jgi:hypothetical protein
LLLAGFLKQGETMPAKTCEVEVFVLVDENGNYVVHKDEDELAEAYDNDISEDSHTGRRTIRIKLSVPLPEYVTMTGTVPALGEPSELTVS